MGIETGGQAMPETNGVVTDAAVAAPKEEMISPKFAELARRERQIQERARQFKAEQAAKASEWEAKEQQYKSGFISKETLKQNPLEALAGLGLTQDQLVQLILNGPQQIDPTIAELQKKYSSIEEKLSQSEKAQQEQQKKAYDQALAQIKSDTDALVASDESYETIKEASATEAVVELIKQTYDTEGKLLSVQEACQQVEEYLVGEGLKMAAWKKVKAKLTPAEVSNELAAGEVVPAKSNENPYTIAVKNLQEKKNPQTQIKTLTNAGTPTTSKPLSPRERALLAFQGKLQK